MSDSKDEILAAYAKALKEARVNAAEVKAQLAGLKAGRVLAGVQQRRARSRTALIEAIRAANPQEP